MNRLATVCVLLALLCPRTAAQEAPGAADAAEPAAFDAAAAVARGCELLVQLQEGEGRREWPYEGVYRTSEPGSKGAVIPMGYRVGGTAIACLALVAAPGYADAGSEARAQAVGRGLDFVLDSLSHPLMEAKRQTVYDVRGWGLIYALQLCMELERRGLVPADQREALQRAVPQLIAGLAELSLPEAGGWNYAGSVAPSPFMTAPALLALFAAAANGHEVSPGVIERALGSLERARTASGGVTYSTPGEPVAGVAEDDLRFMDQLPGAIGRMVASETALTLGGRGDAARLAAAVEAFFEHWNQLEVRRQKSGTHIKPYGVAPYYVFYAHYHAALAIELLEDPAERARQRARLDVRLAQVQDADGSWNDRVFPRSRAFGTSMAMLALVARDAAPRPRWIKVAETR